MTYSELRASDAERDRVVTFLREHALLGRLSDDELEERIGLAYASVTVGDLERLIADLPRASRPAATRRTFAPAAKRSGPSPALIAGGIGALILTGLPFAVIAVVVAVGVALLAVVFALSVVLGPVLLVALLIVLASKRRRTPHRPPTHWRPTY
jgi:Flp pilus assembly protein TadB